ncbi:hypothetical protein Nepgr_016981 [Nepenthes gracilis]|uniref:Uncharacterized protein n=1 Tax=Nepenthes gracilis TaxID=150966 RepID=A0AAD3SNL3_NEPGR|nr:hypothetical protein Nepgr_016981 [Nepenthes gracilis]
MGWEGSPLSFVSLHRPSGSIPFRVTSSSFRLSIVFFPSRSISVFVNCNWVFHLGAGSRKNTSASARKVEC